jgi:hypothetical protein
MNEELLFKTIAGVVPQWFIADFGPNSQAIQVGQAWHHFYTHRALTPDLVRLKNFAGASAESWLEFVDSDLPGALELVQERLALEWLRIKGPRTSWPRLLDYARTLQYRTYENQLVHLNLVISEGHEGRGDISLGTYQKLLDPLASTRQVFFRVDQNLQFVSYEEIPWSAIHEVEDYKFNPEFLQPFASILEAGEFSFHQTSRGDLIVMNSGGLLASKRKGRWHLYDAATFKNCLADILGAYRVGANLFEVVFDLSYRRHGALLVYDPAHQVLEKVVNRECVLRTDVAEPHNGHELLAGSIRPIGIGLASHSHRKKRLLLEIAGLDGAVIFDDQTISAFGAMIESHPDVGSFPGARTTAAYSAFRWGGLPVKISSDGDITFLFKSRDPMRGSCDAALEFL